MSRDSATGKIDMVAFRETIYHQTGADRPEVTTGPKYGTDVSVVDLGGGLSLASASDPLSLIPTLGLAESAWLSVHLTANDLATTGHAPMYAQFVLNLPEWLSDADFRTYWGHIHTYCHDIGLSITGGHTGRVPGQESTVVGGATFSLVAASDSIRTSNLAKPGQTIIVTKGCALSSTAILAMSFPETVKHAVGQAEWQATCEGFYQTSVLPEGLVGGQSPHVRAMHDVTEGGVLGAVRELCHASDCGATIHLPDLPISDTARLIGERFGFDPARAVGAGALLLTCPIPHTPAVVHDLKAAGVTAYTIGQTTSAEQGILLTSKEGNVTFLTENEGQDPYWNAYFRAFQKGWK